MGRRFAVLAAVVSIQGCDQGWTSVSQPDSGAAADVAHAAPQASFEVRGSVEQIDVWKAPAYSKIDVQDSAGTVVQSGATDMLGSFVFRNVPPGSDYTVRVPALASPNAVDSVRVMSIAGSLPGQSFYASQKLSPGFTYITTRDGTKLAAYITLPGPIEKGPYPTVVNYSGYNPAQPGAPLAGYSFLCTSFPVFCDVPNDPSAEIASLMGYATVGVNMRGTGCSGGAYDYFEELQLLDGYDVIEAVAAQNWVKGHRVGMTGLSYPGITQLFVAQTHPPSLAAITPLSVIGSTYSTARPGGIFNDGFALEWITNVLDKAGPYGQGWEQPRVEAGDTICADNQLLHGQKVDVTAEAKDHPYNDSLFAPLSPTAFAREINIPVFLADGFEDEQTGPFFFTLLDQFTSAPVKRFTIYNGVHIDGFAPQVIAEWKAFLDLYVAETVPSINPDLIPLLPELFQTVFMDLIPFPPNRFSSYSTWAAAKAAYEAEPSVHVLFENGGSTPLGAPIHTFEMDFPSWPPSTIQPLRLYFQGNGSLEATPPPDDSALGSSFMLDPAAGHQGILAPGGDVWDPLPDYDWQPLATAYNVVMDSDPLTEDLVTLGSASVDLWVRSPVNDADLQVNLTEIRPDGQERYVQSGWLRASLRELDPSATALWPEHTYTQTDESLLVPGQWTAARIGFPAFGHVIRKGSRVRIIIDTPGNSRAAWTFDLKTFTGTVAYDISTTATRPSSVLLPVLGGVSSTTPLPPCPSLRAEQCRAYAPYVNTPSVP